MIPRTHPKRKQTPKPMSPAGEAISPVCIVMSFFRSAKIVERFLILGLDFYLQDSLPDIL
ncbi:hypothetical protein K170097C1_54190 [Hungatella effluvii]|uniref:Uncharacterized protein n=1 Tax=Hungatella hathewayi TaxID=154046 RepID=A0AA37N2D2_9FIRM|nr:hypothetical protein CE91St56_58230 [Lachnospiraceae bacterium]GKG98492.1 hypothetical protein CE91St55_04740 [Hungatella hathewayi]GKH05315.1 hypothetical protein CE91St54_04230 [Hungatella hathewayi]GKH44780.1 hypothetical protein CE91St57_57540 [Lachnospiraceae bacterium]